MKKTMNENGITLVALVITVIVMLIIAGVAISVLTNDGGLFDKTRLAADEYVESSKKEEQLLNQLLNYLESQNVKSEFELKLENAEELPVTNESDIVLGNKEYKITEPIDVEDFSVIVPQNVKAKLYICEPVKIDNENYAKSGIDVSPSAELELYLYGDTDIISGKGIAGTDATASVCGVGSEGASAGIHVPEGAVLKIYGNKELYVYGGDAGDGGSTTQGNAESSGGSGGGAGAGIGGNGGKGGQPYGIGGSVNKQSIPGTNGENAGDIYIYDDVKVYAYGGSGGSAGDTISGSDSSGSGGYPAAGIGGGGAGAGGTAGSGGDGSGGFSGSASQTNNGSRGYGGVNGAAGAAPVYPAGAGYFEASKGSGWSGYVRGGVGGGAGYYASWYGSTNGATAGNGGNVYIKNMENIYAYNGSYITTSKSGSANNPWGEYQCPIYAQLGINSNALRSANVLLVNSRTGSDMLTELSRYTGAIRTTNYTNSKPKVDGNANLGIGSGAGYIEVSNGTLNQL